MIVNKTLSWGDSVEAPFSSSSCVLLLIRNARERETRQLDAKSLSREVSKTRFIAIQWVYVCVVLIEPCGDSP